MITLNDHPVCVVVMVVGENFCTFSTSFKLQHGFASHFVWMLLK